MTATLILVPDSASYATEDNSSVVSVQLDGGASRSRLDILNPSSFVNVQWTTNANGHRYLRQFFHQEGDDGATPFWCRLILDDGDPDIYLCKFVPQSMQLTSVAGLARVVTARLEVTPNAIGTDDTTFLDNYPFTVPRVNWLANSGFEKDTNADGMSDNWAAFSAGSTGTVAYVRGTTALDGVFNQRVDASALGVSGADKAGIYQKVTLPNVSILDGDTINLSANFFRALGVCKGQVIIQFNNASNAFISSVSSGDVTLPANAWTLLQISGVVPAGTQFLYCYAYAAEGDAGADRILIDAVQLELGPTRGEYFPTKAV